MLLGFIAEAKDKASPVFQKIGTTVDTLRKKYENIFDSFKNKLNEMGTMDMPKIMQLLVSGVVASKGVGAFTSLNNQILNTSNMLESAHFQFKQLFKGDTQKATDSLKEAINLAEYTPLEQAQVVQLYTSLSRVGTDISKSYGKAVDYLHGLDAETSEWLKNFKVTNVSMVTDLAALFGQTGEKFNNFMYGVQKAVMSGGKDLMILRDNMSPEALNKVFGKGGKSVQKIYEDLFKFLKEKSAIGMSALAGNTMEGLLLGFKEFKVRFVQGLIGLPGEGKLLDTYKAGLSRIYNRLNELFSNEQFLNTMRDALVPLIKMFLKAVEMFANFFVKVGLFLGRHPFLTKLIVGMLALVTIVPIVTAVFSALGIIIGFLIAKTALVGIAIFGVLTKFRMLFGMLALIKSRGLTVGLLQSNFGILGNIIAFVYLKLKPFIPYFLKFGRIVKQFISGIWSKFTGTKFGNLFTGIKPFFVSLGNIIKQLPIINKLVPIFEKVGKIFGFLSKGVGKILTGIIGKVLVIVSIWQIIKDAMSIWKDNLFGIKDLFTKTGSVIRDKILAPFIKIRDFFAKLYHMGKMFFDIIFKGGFYLSDYMAIGPDAVKIIKFFTTDLGIFLRSIGVMVDKIKKFFEFLKKTFSFMTTGMGRMASLGAGLGGLIGSIFGPLGSVIGAAIGAGIGIAVAGIINMIQNWKQFKQGIVDTTVYIKNNMVKAFQVMIEYAGKVFGEERVQFILGMFKDVKNYVVGFFTYVKGLFNIYLGIGQVLVGLFSGNKGLQKKGLENMKQGFIGFFKGIISMWVNYWKITIKMAFAGFMAVANIGRWLAEKLAFGLMWVIDNIPKLIDKLVGWIFKGLDGLDQWLKKMVPEPLYKLFHIGIIFFKGMVGTVASVAKFWWKMQTGIFRVILGLSKWLGPILKTFERIGLFLFDLVGAFVRVIASGIGGLFKKLFSKETGSSIWSGAKKFVDGILGKFGVNVDWDKVSDFFSGVADKIAEWSDMIWKAIKIGFDWAWNTVSAWFKKLGQFFSNIFGYLLEAVNRIIAAGYNLMANMPTTSEKDKAKFKESSANALREANVLRGTRMMQEMLSNPGTNYNKAERILNVNVGDFGNVSREEVKAIMTEVMTKLKNEGELKSLYLDNIVVQETGNAPVTIGVKP